jgi:radical SAM superfamily enzyme YgiQ (UPF0313 family)
MTNVTTKSRRVALVEPRFPRSAGMLVHLNYEPFGLLMLGAALRQAGFTVRLWSQGANEEPATFAARIARWQPEIVGVSVYSANVHQGRRVSAALRSAGVRGPVVFGGAHATATPELVLEPEVDYVVRGEGEHVGPALFSALLHGREIDGIPGVAYARDGTLRETMPFELIEDLSGLPWASRDLGPPTYEYGLGAYGRHKAVVMSSRGCRNACDFCLAPLLSRRRVRRRDPADVAAEAEALKRDHGVRFLYFGDDDFFAHRDHTEAVCRALIRRRVDLPFFCMGRLDLLEEGMLDLLARAGCQRFLVGIERPPGETRWTRKARSERRVAQRLRQARRRGIFVHVGLIIGVPDETEASLAATADFVSRVEADYLSLTFFTPYRGTKAHEHLRASGIEIFGGDDAFALDRPTFRHPVLSDRDLLGWRQRIYRAFYLSPRYLGRAAALSLRRPRIGLDFGRLLWRGVREGLLKT